MCSFSFVKFSVSSLLNLKVSKCNASAVGQGLQYVTSPGSQRKYRPPVYMLHHCSFPMILGSNCLCTKGRVTDHHSISVQYNRFKVRHPGHTVLPPNSEMFIWAKVSKMLPQGLHGVCAATAQTLQYSLLVSKSTSSVSILRILFLSQC